MDDEPASAAAPRPPPASPRSPCSSAAAAASSAAASSAAAAAASSASAAAFVPPSVHADALLAGASYSHFSPVPPALLGPDAPPCVVGVDEAGRGPVLGPMVYAVFAAPAARADALLGHAAHRFADSKALAPAARARLMRALCDAASPLRAQCAWAATALSARDVAAAMLRPGAPYNLNAQAEDATVALVRALVARGVNVRHIYVDTVGPPAAYQARLQRLFPAAAVTVAKKADSLYPCVSAASVCAKVTRDAALETLYAARRADDPPPPPPPPPPPGSSDAHADAPAMAWGSGYPSDARCVSWMRSSMHPLFGWGPECRFSWATAKDMLEGPTAAAVKVDWPDPDRGETSRLTDFFVPAAADGHHESDELGSWFGTPARLEAL